MREMDWGSLGDGRVWVVEARRCLACGALDLFRRDFERENEKYQPSEGVAAPGDGLHLLTRPKPQEV